MTTSISSEAQKKSWMLIRRSKFKVYLLIDIFEKIFCIMMTVKINYIKDAHNNGKNYFDTDIPKSFKIGPKTPKIWGEM